MHNILEKHNMQCHSWQLSFSLLLKLTPNSKKTYADTEKVNMILFIYSVNK